MQQRDGDCQLVEDQVRDCFDGVLLPGAHVIRRSDLALGEQQRERLTVVLDVEPVSLLFAVAMKGEGESAQRVRREPRHQLFDVLMRPDVVR